MLEELCQRAYTVAPAATLHQRFGVLGLLAVVHPYEPAVAIVRLFQPAGLRQHMCLDEPRAAVFGIDFQCLAADLFRLFQFSCGEQQFGVPRQDRRILRFGFEKRLNPLDRLGILALSFQRPAVNNDRRRELIDFALNRQRGFRGLGITTSLKVVVSRLDVLGTGRQHSRREAEHCEGRSQKRCESFVHD